MAASTFYNFSILHFNWKGSSSTAFVYKLFLLSQLLLSYHVQCTICIRCIIFSCLRCLDSVVSSGWVGFEHWVSWKIVKFSVHTKSKGNVNVKRRRLFFIKNCSRTHAQAVAAVDFVALLRYISKETFKKLSQFPSVREVEHLTTKKNMWKQTN